MKTEIKKVLYKFLQDGLSADDAANQLINLFESEEKRKERVNDVVTRLSASLGECVEGNNYEITAHKDGEFWINHKEVGSGEPLNQWIKSALIENASIKYEREINDILRSVFFDDTWMDESDYQKILPRLLELKGITIQDVSDYIETGVDNGYTVEYQLELVKRLYKLNKTIHDDQRRIPRR